MGQIHTDALAAMPVAFPTAGFAEPPTLRPAPSALIMSTRECEGSLAKQQKSPPTRLLKSSGCQIKYQIAEKAEPEWWPGGCALVRSAVQSSTSSDPIFILHKVRRGAIQEPCRGDAEGGGMSGGVAKCLGGFGASATSCNTHLPLGTGLATHGAGEETHVVGLVGSWA